jgi:aminoglycoside phosphotransferase (APT) family kinase protein
LSDFGKPSGFYNRQIKTLTAIATSQASAVDVDTGVPVGKIPHFDEMVAFFNDPSTQPKDRATLIHGDYKIDNLVFHSTEPKVVGILEYVDAVTRISLVLPVATTLINPISSWEMSTLGHPLSDLANLLSPFIFALNPSIALSAHTNRAFSPFALTPGLPSRAQCIAWYAEVAGWDPGSDMRWGDTFGVFRNGVVMHGIAARYALRQASSQRAQEHGSTMGAYSDFAWSLVAMLKEENARAKYKL